ncbi:hypothetical protein GCM10007096_11040 [Pullulanibacillus pueri]|uniref:Uncharacterized protein n=1 Tax=Pullulanibacillus pueri TaxID=1437324 RepID=A0A8J2ZTZ0_9BACL|nr:hypothetical protein GCM10007096_11040 [Pullulanibacillus pueri]
MPVYLNLRMDNSTKPTLAFAIKAWWSQVSHAKTLIEILLTLNRRIILKRYNGRVVYFFIGRS